MLLNKRKENKMRITHDMVERWLGSDITRQEMIALLVEIANNDYPQTILYADICLYMEE